MWVRSRFLQEGSEAEDPEDDVGEGEHGEQGDPGPSVAGGVGTGGLERSGRTDQDRRQHGEEQQRDARTRWRDRRLMALLAHKRRAAKATRR